MPAVSQFPATVKLAVYAAGFGSLLSASPGTAQTQPIVHLTLAGGQGHPAILPVLNLSATCSWAGWEV